MKRCLPISVLLCTLCIVLFCSCTAQPKQEHTSDVLFYISNHSMDESPFLSHDDLKAAESLIDSVEVLLKSRKVCDEILAESGCNYSYEELRAMLSVTAVEDTEVFKVTVTAPLRKDSKRIARAVTTVLPITIESVIQNSNVSVIDTV